METNFAVTIQLYTKSIIIAHGPSLRLKVVFVNSFIVAINFSPERLNQRKPKLTQSIQGWTSPIWLSTFYTFFNQQNSWIG